jgi:ubiquinone/menaquinone biosynthesis C-methylase UbiE
MSAAPSRHDAWSAGDSYDQYMGRWSRLIAPLFLKWLDAPPQREWLDVGCGTGALSSAILAAAQPRSITAIDPSEGFLAKARASIADARVTFRVGDAAELPIEDSSCDIAASALVLNFVPDRVKALGEMKRAVRPGGMIGFYVWDYPGGGVGFMRAFWAAAVGLDPAAKDLSETSRFPFCTPEGLASLAHEAGLAAVECVPIEAHAIFRDFDDFWHPFTLGAGPAPGYCMSLAPEARQQLKDKLNDTLTRAGDGSIHFALRAWAVKTAAR